MFISFEGIDKSGKTTQIHLLADFLARRNYPVVVTQEPGGTAAGKKIKKVLLGDCKIHPLTELFLYLADRAEHVKKIIEPSLKQNKIIISDRYADATLAYQGYGRGLSIELIEKLNKEVTQGIWPDITFLLDLEPEIAMHRKKMTDRIEKEESYFHKRVREGYLSIARVHPERIKVIKADTSICFIHEQIKKLVLDEF